MAKLKQPDLAFWQLFVEACGGRCNACGKSGVPLERGHLQRHADDGAADDYHNLIPLCRPCNAKNRNGLTDDTRPADWLDAFVRLIHAKLGAGIRLKTSEPTHEGVAPLKPGTNGSQVIENNGLLDPADVEFVWSNLLCPTQKRTAPLKPMSDREATHLIERTIKYGAEKGEVPLPLTARKGKLVQLAKAQVTKHGETIFTKAVREFVERDELRKCPDSWGVLCDNFDLYLEYALGRERRARQKQADEQEAVRQKVTEQLTTKISDEEFQAYKLRKERTVADLMGLLDKIAKADEDDELKQAWHDAILLEIMAVRRASIEELGVTVPASKVVEPIRHQLNEDKNVSVDDF